MAYTTPARRLSYVEQAIIFRNTRGISVTPYELDEARNDELSVAFYMRAKRGLDWRDRKVHQCH